MIWLNETEAKRERVLTEEEKTTVIGEWGNSERYIFFQEGDQGIEEYKQWQEIVKNQIQPSND